MPVSSSFSQQVSAKVFSQISSLPVFQVAYAEGDGGGDGGGGDSGGGGCCGDAGGGADSGGAGGNDSPAPPVPPPVFPHCTIYATYPQIRQGDSTTLIFSATNAGPQGTINNGVGTVTVPGSAIVSPLKTTTYTLTVRTGFLSAKCKVKVTVLPPLPPPPSTPSCSIYANPNHITVDQDPLLTWTSQNATSATLDQGIGSVPTTGSTSVFPQQTTTYTLTVYGPGGSATCNTTITVEPRYVPPATCTIYASPSTVNQGGASTLTWSSTDSTDQWISNIGNVSPQGSMQIFPPYTLTYVLHVSGLGGNGECQTTVTVNDYNPPPPPQQTYPSCTISAQPGTIWNGGKSKLVWQSQNASSASIDQGIANVNLSGSRNVSPQYDTTYTMTVMDDYGHTANCNTSVTVKEKQHQPHGKIQCFVTGDMPGDSNFHNAFADYIRQGYTSFMSSHGYGSSWGDTEVEVD